MHKDYDFSAAKRAGSVPHLAKFQRENSGKTRITIMLDNVVLSAFRERASESGVGYQTLINQALVDALNEEGAAERLTPDLLREILCEELEKRKR